MQKRLESDLRSPSRRRRIASERTLILLLASSVVPQSHAQWSATILQPPEATASKALATSGRYQAGYVVIDSVRRASVWNLSSATRVDLHPPGVMHSLIQAIDGERFAGSCHLLNHENHAALWNDANSTWIDLHPVGAASSFALGASAGRTVGYTRADIFSYAAMWGATSDSWVGLHAGGGAYSFATAASGSEQAGYAWTFGIEGFVPHASVWSGTAASWVDLHTPWAPGSSYVFAMSEGLQAGFLILNGKSHACFWKSTAESRVDLHPAGATQSYAYATSGAFQAGHAIVGNNYHAGLWQSTPHSWFDLHSVLPPEFIDSYALGISIHGDELQVVGYGIRSGSAAECALLWTRPLPPPTCAADLSGDGAVTITDLNKLITQFGIPCAQVTWRCADFNADGWVNTSDLAYFLGQFGRMCP